MSKEDADLLAIGAEERGSLIRLDSGKVNLVRRLVNARWFKFISVPLGNKTELYPSGDEIHTVERWNPPDLLQNVSNTTWNEILTEIDKGLPSGELYSDHGKATDRAAWRVVMRHTDRTEPQARQIIKAWVRSGVLYHCTYHDPKVGKDKQGLRVQPAKRPS